eukprot:Sspe_Gene.34049::Locus_16566_Transcript_1_1_Confidence_1.000_Length_1056::g.34049::m.34049
MMVDVTVKVIGGATYTLSVPSGTSLAELKNELHSRGAPPPGEQKLVLNGQPQFDLTRPVDVINGKWLYLVKVPPPDRPQIIVKHAVTGRIIVVDMDREATFGDLLLRVVELDSTLRSPVLNLGGGAVPGVTTTSRGGCL